VKLVSESFRFSFDAIIEVIINGIFICPEKEGQCGKLFKEITVKMTKEKLF
jgi:hypothetical protein